MNIKTSKSGNHNFSSKIILKMFMNYIRSKSHEDSPSRENILSKVQI